MKIQSQGANTSVHQRFGQAGSKGFSLVELLIIIAIVAILAAIAIPQFTSYRRSGVDAQMKSDLRNAAVVMESYFAKNSTYPSSSAAVTAQGFNGTQGITLTVNIISPNRYQLTATASGGSQPSFTFDNSTGVTQ